MIQAIAGVVVVIFCLLAYIQLQRLKIKKLAFDKQQLVAENQAQRREIDNAKVRVKTEHIINRLNHDDVDEQLHKQGYFRDS